MASRISFFFKLLKKSFLDWQEDQAPRIGAALAYYSIFSIPPLLVLIISISGMAFGREAVTARVIGEIQNLIGQQGAAAVASMLESAAKTSSGMIAAAIGVITLLLGASGVFGELKSGLNTMWEVKISSSSGLKYYLKERLFTFGLVLGLGFLFLVSLIASTVVTALQSASSGLIGEHEWLVAASNFALSFAVLSFLFAVLLRYLPDARHSWRACIRGAIFTTAFFVIGKHLIGLYLGTSNIVSGFGAAGSVVLIFIWIYYSAQIFLFGAEFTHAYATAIGEEPVLKKSLQEAEVACLKDEGMNLEECSKPEETELYRPRKQPPPLRPMMARMPWGTLGLSLLAYVFRLRRRARMR